MKASFIIWRISHYRILAPVIEEALARGWSVECWHDYGHPKNGTKGYQFPQLDQVPIFKKRQPTVRSFRSQEELEKLPVETKTDVVLCHHQTGQDLGKNFACKYIEVQHNAETFWGQSLEQIQSAAFTAMYSPWWLDYAVEHYEAVGGLNERQDNVRQKLLKKAVFVGVPELDRQRCLEPDVVRETYGIPKNKKVVCFLPFAAISSIAFWPERIYLANNRLKQLFHIVTQRRFEYLPHVRHHWDDKTLAASLRMFCDRNDAWLVVKSRKKTPVASYLQNHADLVLFDQAHYPATLFEILSVADLTVSFHSNAVFASVAAGVPHYSIRIPIDDFYDGETDRDRDGRLRMNNYFQRMPEGPFDFDGVVTAADIPEAITDFPDRDLASFALDPGRAKLYVSKFIGPNDGRSSSRLLDELEA